MTFEIPPRTARVDDLIDTTVDLVQCTARVHDLITIRTVGCFSWMTQTRLKCVSDNSYGRVFFIIALFLD